MELDAERLGIAIRLAGGGLALLGVLTFVVVPTQIDALRQNLFDVRRSLFLAALHHDGSFETPAYVRLRLMINGYLRFAERMTTPRIVFMVATAPKIEMVPLETLLLQVEDAEYQQKLTELNKRFQRVVMRHLLCRCPVSTPLTLGVAALVIVTRIATKGQIVARTEPIAKELGEDPGTCHLPAAA